MVSRRERIARRIRALLEHAQTLNDPRKLAAIARATDKLEVQLERVR